MATERGHYRAIHSVLIDSPEFVALSPEAKLIFFTIRLCSENNIASIFVFYKETLPNRTGLTAKVIDGALQELTDTHWIAYQHPVLWIRNGLMYDPGVQLSNPKHKMGVVKVMNALPKLEIVVKFASYYSLSDALRYPSEGLYDTHPIQDKDKEKDKEKEKEQEGVQGEPTASLNGWPPEWSTLKEKILTLPYFKRDDKYLLWVSDLAWWQTEDEHFESAPITISEMMVAAVAHMERESYKPRSQRAIRQKIHNCMEFEARRVEREAKR